MAETSNPQFVAACSATSSASGIICAASALGHIVTTVFTFYIVSRRSYKSDYKWSMKVILIIQSIGVILGSIAPIFRCFADLSFKVTNTWNWNHINVLKVEKYWTRTLSDWQQSSISFSSRNRKYKIVIHNTKSLVLSFCIGIQKTAVVACKMIGLFKLLFVLPAMLNPEPNVPNIDLPQYVLLLQDDIELVERTLNGFREYVNLVIQNAENHQPSNLMNLLGLYNGFQGVRYHDTIAEEYLHCWSLPLVTLTTIAISLPDIQNDRVDLLISVSEDLQNRFSEPLPWIGIYIALASLICVIAMVADLFHGLRNRKLWFPCRFFTLNAASLSVIAVAMKLPMDLNNSMPGHVDQVSKAGSMAFMCTMMANVLPSLATMTNTELFTNIIALGVLVITLVVNVCIQINTGVLTLYINNEDLHGTISDARDVSGNATIHNIAAIIYVVMLLMLLIIHACSSLAIVESKKMLQSKYQEACSATSSASGIICAASALGHIVTTVFTFYIVSRRSYKSDYKWSMKVILIIQSIGVILGSIAPIFRCFADLSFKVTNTWNWNHINVLKVEKYWTRTLSDWQQSSISFSSRNRKYKIVIHNTKSLVLSFCIGIQKTAVVACKMIGLFKLLFVLPAMLNPEPNVPNIDLPQYVLLLQDDIELVERTLNGFREYVNLVIQNAENHQPSNLMNLLGLYNGFQGVRYHDTIAEEYLHCWSLPLVTLTTIAISLPDIQNDRVDLLISVSEGLAYVKLVEESLNTTNDYITIQKAARTLWLEVEFYNGWLGNDLQNHAPGVNRAGQILQWFTQLLGETTEIINTLNERKIPNLNPEEMAFIENWRRAYLNNPIP
nr:hypothetical protein CTI12_AA006920 [Tanacetum cinerariifolium]